LYFRYNGAKLSYEDIDIYLDKAQTIKVRSTADVRDSNLYMLNSSWVRSFSHSWNPVFTVNLNVGKEDNENSSRDDLSRDIYSAGIALSVQPASKWGVQAALTYQRSKYDDAFSINAPSRSDHYAVAALTAAYSIDRNWSLRGEYSYIDQHSNIGFYDYDRHVVGAKLRYDFK
jgi:opacity protein-like surface antigen